MADSDKSLRIGVEVSTQEAISELDRYNKKLLEMAQRTEAAAAAAKEQAEAEAYATLKLEAKTKAAAKTAETSAQVAKADREVAASYKRISQEEIAAATAGTAATTRWTASKKELKDAIRGLMFQFPLLGRIAAIAMNPLTISVTALVGAVTILRNKFAGVGSVLESSGFAADKVNALADAWKRYAEAMKAAVDSGDRLAQTLKRIEERFDLIQRLSGKDELNPLAKKMQARQMGSARIADGARAMKRGRQMEQHAGRIKLGGSDKEDASVLTALESEANNAQVELAGVNELIRIGELLESKGNLRDVIGAVPEGVKWLREFGMAKPSAILPDLYKQRGEYSKIVSRPGSFRRRMEVNSARRSAYTSEIDNAYELQAIGSAEIAEGQAMIGAADVEFAASAFQARRPMIATRTGSGWSQTPQAIAAVRDANRAAASLERAFDAYTATMNRMKDRIQRDTKPE